MFDPHAAGGLNASLELRLGENRFHAEIANGTMNLDRGSANQPDAVLEANPDTLAALVYGGQKLAEALRTGALKVEGDKAVVKRFVTLFPMPRPAPATWRQE
jgi:putative sterol carrier protein